MMFQDITLTSDVLSIYGVCPVVCPCNYSHMLIVCCRRNAKNNISKSDKNFFDKGTIVVDFRGWWCHGDGDTARISQRKPQRDSNVF